MTGENCHENVYSQRLSEKKYKKYKTGYGTDI